MRAAQHALAVAVISAAVTASRAWPTEEPFWPHYPGRSLQVLDGSWDFLTAKQNIDPVGIPYASAKALIDGSSDTMDVPKACDVTPPGIEGPRGTFLYRTTFDATPGKSTLLQFMACSFYCRVFVDGREVGDHRAGGYSPFWLTAPPASSSSREVLVVVNNDFNSTTAPVHTGGDFYNYAGLTRNVLVFEAPSEAAFIHRVATFPVNATSGEIHANVTLAGPSVRDTVGLSIAWNGGADGPTRQHPVVDGTVVLTGLRVPDFKPWAVGAPNLFTMRVTLHSDGAAADSVEVRGGVRVLGTERVGADSAARVTVNGDPVKLYGVNRHTMWPDTGSGLSLEQVRADLALLQDLGVNWVRGAHYPQDQRFLDMLDEAGIGIWEETLGPGVATKDLQSPYWMRYQLQQVAEMVETSANHPSVLYHAFYNEGPSSDPSACEGYNASSMAIRRRVTTAGSPPSRLVTYASDKKTKDVCLGVTDVVSFNDYPCWYGPQHCDDPDTACAAKWLSHAQWSQSHFPSKPFGISETGGGGVYEWTNSTDVRWSQKYQTELVAANALFAGKSDLVNHFTIWQFNDIKANEGDTGKCGQCDYAPHAANLTVPWTCDYIDVTCGRPGGENHKGQVDFWRRTKSTFGSLKDIFRQFH